MNIAFFLMILLGMLYAAGSGNVEPVAQAAVKAGAASVETAMELAGGFAFFGGVIRILEDAGAVRMLVRILKRPLLFLFGRDAPEQAMEAISMNLAANMMGLGNAATPMGIRAAKLLTAENQSYPSAALSMFLVINATSVQLFPTSVVALRYATESRMPEAVVLPGLIASTASTAIGILLCKAMEGRTKQ